MCRVALWVVVVALAMPSGSAAAVRLVVRSDGSKVISNVGSKSAKAGGTDLVWLAKQRNRPSVYDRLIDEYADRYEVDPMLVRAVIQVESGYDPMTISHKGARGLMQLMPGTADRFAVQQIHDPEENIRGGVEYLSELLRLFSYDLRRALAAYNAGENAVIRHGGIPPYPETQHYVQKALTVYYGRPYGSISVQGSARKPGETSLRHGLKRTPMYGGM